MAEGSPTIVVKKIKKVSGGSHGGAWKIAYADFVTAMMAFFLLMWLLGSSTQGVLDGIAEYFQTPLKVAMAGGNGAGGSDSILEGGGKDLTKNAGQINMNDENLTKKTNVNATKKEQMRKELEALKQLQGKVTSSMESNPKFNQYKSQIKMDLSQDGLKIQIVDEQNRPMFDNARAELKPYAKDILREIGKLLNDLPNKIALSGHTDRTPYASGEKGYSNWELSADRANASRRELINGGLLEDKIIQVVGLASAVLYNKENPLAPINRRISIIVMNKSAEERITQDGKIAEVQNATDAGKALDDSSKK